MSWYTIEGHAIIGMADMPIALVTGDVGFIGSHLVLALRKRGDYHVIGLDWQRGPHEDIRTCDLPDADVCFHLAAQTNARSVDVITDAEINVLGALRILEHYRERVVFAASTAKPLIPYAISKLASEQYCRLYGARVVRMCNISGPGGHGVFEAFAHAAVLQIAGKGDQKREYASVNRAVAAFLHVANCPPGYVTEVRGTELTVLEIADLVYPMKPRKFVEQQANDLTNLQ